MKTKPGFRLRDADLTLRLFLSAFLLVASTGYAVGLLFVEFRTGLTSSGVEEQFLGTQEDGQEMDMAFEKSAGEMFVFLHNHLLGISMLMAATGAVFYFSSLAPEWVRRLLLIEPMAAVLTTFGGIALVRFVSPVFSWLVVLSGASMVAGYVAMVVLIMLELWLPRGRESGDSLAPPG